MCFCAAWALACILRVARTSADGQRVECVPDRKESQQAIRQQGRTKASRCPHVASRLSFGRRGCLRSRNSKLIKIKNYDRDRTGQGDGAAGMLVMLHEGRSGMHDDGCPTVSSRLQTETEELVLQHLVKAKGLEEAGVVGEHVQGGLTLQRQQHVAYLRAGLETLSAGHAALDASRPWLCYWILHALALLDALPDEDTLNRAATFLARCQDKNGGFAGGPGQMPHLAPTYAAINALTTIGTDYALSVVDRPALHAFLCSMKDPSGGFTMHLGGEVDVRGSYCALSAALLSGVLTPQLKLGAGDYILRCQTYEGGLGGEPGNEAHGGYTFCAVAGSTHEHGSHST